MQLAKVRDIFTSSECQCFEQLRFKKTKMNSHWGLCVSTEVSPFYYVSRVQFKGQPAIDPKFMGSKLGAAGTGCVTGESKRSYYFIWMSMFQATEI